MLELGLLTVHGMGETTPDYAEDFLLEVRDRFGADNGRLVTETIFYQDILQPFEEDYFNRVRRRVDWDRLRKFLLYGICDAATLESQKQGTDSPYYQAQMRILVAFRTLYRALEGSNRRTIVVAQSLGGQVLSNYLWDALKDNMPSIGVWSVPQQFQSREEEDFCRGKAIVRLFTTGCNIPIFVAGRPRDRIEPIPRPNNEFEWHNYYDEDDVLGWPLRDLSDDYSERVKRDHRINAGVLTGFTPLSHVNYWRDSDFLKPLVKHIKRYL